MLHSLSIENYAIIAKVEVNFDPKLNIITGETGAGKSILIGALSLIMGQRADTKVLYDQKTKCTVEAIFVNFPEGIKTYLESQDLDSEKELIIRREISPTGRSRAFVNDTPTNLKVLQELSGRLIDLNQQFNITDIQDKKFQLAIVDALADNSKPLAEYQTQYRAYRLKEKQLAELQQAEATQVKELEFMKFQHNELMTAGLTAGEQTTLESEQKLLGGMEEITQLLAETRFLLAESDANMKDSLLSLMQRWSGLREAEAGLAEGADVLSRVITDMDTVIRQAETLEDKLEQDPGRLSQVEKRLDTLYSLQRKHGVQSLDALVSIQDELSQKLSSYENRNETMAALEEELSTMEVKLKGMSDKLSSRRVKVFKKLEKEVNKRLTDLSMPSAEIKVDHEKDQALGPAGTDRLDILFKANKGSTFQEVKRVASGGETSRLMLAIKATVAHKMALPSMIFDEIDTGVSGDVAGKMGGILSNMAQLHQLICITHSPQVSARATRHFHVSKQETKARTLTQVTQLDQEARILELAKMLSGDPPSTFALDNAKDLLSV